MMEEGSSEADYCALSQPKVRTGPIRSVVIEPDYVVCSRTCIRAPRSVAAHSSRSISSKVKVDEAADSTVFTQSEGKMTSSHSGRPLPYQRRKLSH